MTDSTDLRVDAILGEAFAEARGLIRDDPGDECECGHVRDAHGYARGCCDCECRRFVKEVP